MLLTAASALVASLMFALSQPAVLNVDGQRIISDVPPVTQMKEAFVPVRAVAEGLGAQTSYDAKTGIVELVRGSDVFRIQIGSRIARLNGSKMTISSAPFTVRGRTMIGVRALARAFGTAYHYDVSRATIDVTTPGVIEAGAQEFSE